MMNQNPIRDIPHYLYLFQSYVGARIYLVFGLTLLAALAEGLGIVMLLPLLGSIDAMGTEEVTTGIAGMLAEVLAWLGLTGSSLAVLLFIGGFFLLKGLFLFFAGFYQVHLHAELQRELKARLYDDYSHMRFGYYVSRDTGHFVNVINSQVALFLNAFNKIIGLGTRLVTTAVYLGVAFAAAWQFGLMAAGVGLLVLTAFRKLNTRVRALSRKSSQEAGYLSKLLIQALHAFKYLVATAQTCQLRQGVMTSIHRLTSYEKRIGIASAFTSALREPLAVIAILFIVIVQSVWFEQPLGPIMVSILLFYRGFNAIVHMQEVLQGAMAHAGGIEMVRDEFAQQAKNREMDGAIALSPLTREIRLEDVYFAYELNQGEVLKGVTLVIPVRTSVAFVGESGAGKSTLADLLSLMLKPQKGQVVIDSVSGDKVQLVSWRKQIGYVSQDTVIFDDTIANNICMWQGDASNDETVLKNVREAARQAHIDHFIDTLPDGYQTLVGDRGVRLSGGQRQRLFIARELFRKPNLLILDEATSALDSESERYIQQSIDALKGQVTVVIIAHRLSTIRNVDQIYVFDKGRLVEQGSYQQLRDADDSRFSQLVAMQSL